jgi:hypothetical protein
MSLNDDEFTIKRACVKSYPVFSYVDVLAAYRATVVAVAVAVAVAVVAVVAMHRCVLVKK